jgi:4'-phosphopantetheinyl transferase
MPVIYNQVVYDDCQLAIWEITESYDEMYSRIHFFEGEKENFKNYKSDLRQLEWLSVRRLLREVRGVPTQIVYNESRKPFLFNSDQHISISHSRNLTAVLLSNTRKLGLDLEYMAQDIKKVAHKFLNRDEYIVENKAKRNFQRSII